MTGQNRVDCMDANNLKLSDYECRLAYHITRYASTMLSVLNFSVYNIQVEKDMKKIKKKKKFEFYFKNKTSQDIGLCGRLSMAYIYIYI